MNGRIVGVRYKGGQFVIRLDLHPYNGDLSRRPVLHIHYGSSKTAENNHVTLYTFDQKPSWWRRP
jgi:hypothetical protein